MFLPIPELQHIAVPSERIVAVIESINTPNVVIPGRDAEPTRAYIIGVRNSDGSFTLYIYLHQIESNRPAIYVSDPRNIVLAQYPEIEGEAIQFVESMGFMLDNVNFRRLQSTQQTAVLDRIPAFHADLSRFSTKEEEAPAEPEPPADPAPLLQGLDTLEPLETFETLESLEPLDGAEEVLPVATVEHSGLMSLSDSERAEIDNTFADSSAGIASLSEEDRRRLTRLLIAF